MSNDLDIARKHFELGSKKFEEKLYSQAEQEFSSSLNFLPNRVSTLSKLILCKIQLKKFQECEKLLSKIQKIDKDYVYGKFCKALYLGEILEFEKSKEELLTINIQNEPLEFQSTFYNCLATTLYYLDEYENSVSNYLKSIELNPNNYSASVNLGTVYLSKNNFKDGWKYYEHRLKKNNLDHKKYPLKIKEIESTKILIRHEQGIGDTIQFSRLITELKKYNCEIDFLIPQSLNNLFSIDGVNIINKIISNDKYKYEINLMSLPFLLNLDLKKPSLINTINSDLLVNKKNVKDKNLKIGIAWSGNQNYQFDIMRSIKLESLKNIIDLQNQKPIKFYCLQKNIRDNDLDFFKNSNIINLGNLNFYDLAKEINNLDLVISSCTSILHLSSSLKMKTFGLLANKADWRWLDDSKKSNWYETLEIFKLKKNQNWEDLSKTVVENILKLI